MLPLLVLITITAISQGLPKAERGELAPGILLKQGGNYALDIYMNTVTENLKKRITDAVDIPGIRKKSTCGGRVCALKFGHIKLQGLSTISMMGTVTGGDSPDFMGIWIIGIINAITAKSRGKLTIKGRKRNKKFPLTLTAAVKQVDIDALASIDKNSCSVTRTSSYLTVYETNITFSRTDYNVILETAPLIEEKIKNYIENFASTLQTLLYDVMRTTPLPDGVKNQLQCYETTTATTTTTKGTTTTKATTGQTTSGQGWRSNDQEEVRVNVKDKLIDVHQSQKAKWKD